jgi:hypothetical protein
MTDNVVRLPRPAAAPGRSERPPLPFARAEPFPAASAPRSPSTARRFTTSRQPCRGRICMPSDLA